MAPRLEIEPLPWDEFRPWLRDVWQPGQHFSVIAPTGAGKTTFVGGILGAGSERYGRRYVLALDAKGGDDTLTGLGYPRLEAWPGARRMQSMVAKNDEDGKVSRYVVGPRVYTERDRAALEAVTGQAMSGAFDMGGWTVYADELQLLTDPRMMNLRRQADQMLISARNKKLSFVSSYQAPSWVTPHAARMSTWVAVSYTRDRDMVNDLAAILGRPKPEIRGCVDALEPYTWVICGRNPREPLRVTLPPPIAAVADPSRA